MKIEDIRELHEMGFSNDQIMQLSGSPEAPAVDPVQPADPKPVQSADPKPVQPADPKPVQPADPKPVAPTEDDRITGLQNQISEAQKQIQQLTKQLQAANRQAARIDALPADDLQTQTDKIMAELIRPTIKKEGE